MFSESEQPFLSPLELELRPQEHGWSPRSSFVSVHVSSDPPAGNPNGISSPYTLVCPIIMMFYGGWFNKTAPVIKTKTKKQNQKTIFSLNTQKDS